MNTNTLRYVITVAEEGSFTRAARKLFISQPSLSQNIQSLERQLGTELFDRNSTPVRLTYAGEEYVKWARRVVDSEAQTLRRIGDIAGSSRRRLRVGVSPYRSLHIFPEVLDRFYRETGGQCTVVLVEQRSSEYMHLLDEGRVDLLIDRPADPTSPYESVTLREEQLILAVSRRYALPDEEAFPSLPLTMDRRILCRKVPAERLREIPSIILSEKQRMSSFWQQVCEVMGVVPPVIMECQSIEMAYTMVRRGMGMTLIPDSLVRFDPEDRSMVYYMVAEYPLSRTMSVLYPRKRYLGNDARIMIELLQEVLS